MFRILGEFEQLWVAACNNCTDMRAKFIQHQHFWSNRSGRHHITSFSCWLKGTSSGIWDSRFRFRRCGHQPADWRYYGSSKLGELCPRTGVYRPSDELAEPGSWIARLNCLMIFSTASSNLTIKDFLQHYVISRCRVSASVSFGNDQFKLFLKLFVAGLQYPDRLTILNTKMHAQVNRSL